MVSKLITYIAIFILLATGMVAIAQTGKKDMRGLGREIFALVNKHRAGKGLPPLVMNEAIAAEAQKHSRNMASGKVPFGHDGFEGRSDRLLNGIKGANASAENVASSPYDAERVVKMWLESPRHLKNIEGSYNLTGIGIAKGTDGNLLYTQLFINSK